MGLDVFKIFDIILLVFLGSGAIAMVVATIRFITGGSDRYSGKVSTDNTTDNTTDRRPGCFDENDPIRPGW